MNKEQSPYAHFFQDTQYFNSHDGLKLRYVSLKTKVKEVRGTVVLLNGWTEFIEKYGEPISIILEKGFNVFSMDWRGQGLSSRTLTNREKGTVNDFEEFVLDLKKFVAQNVEPEAVKPLILMAHSMGGNISIQYLHSHPGAIDRAILCSPMFDLPVGVVQKSVFSLLARTAKMFGLGSGYVPGRSDWSEIPFEENRVTSDAKRYEHDLELLRNNPDLRIGGPTYSWLSAAIKAIKRIQSQRFLEKVQIPIMILSAGADQVVSIPAQEFASKNLPDCQLVTIPNGNHELLRETDAIQKLVWESFDRFVN